VVASRTVDEDARPIAVDELTLEDLESVRLMLRGSSVIDWYQLDFRDEADVHRFLRVNEFDPESDDGWEEGTGDDRITE